MIRIDQLKLPCGTDRGQLEQKIRKLLALSENEKFTWKIVRHSVDSRRRPELYDIYAAEVSLGNPKREEKLCAKRRNRNIRFTQPVQYAFPQENPELPRLNSRPVIVGFGPAGIFCALMLARAEYRPIVIERGAPMEERAGDVERFWKTGVLDSSSNIQFGEGGAGTFSDGKLTTGVKDKCGRIERVLEELTEAGAPEDIRFEYHPHIGTDLLRGVIVRIREEIIRLGGEVRFHERLDRIEQTDGRVTGVWIAGKEEYFLPAETVVLAPGHSARDTIRAMYADGIPMTQKNFAVGCRLSHPQKLIDRWAYGVDEPEDMRRLGLPHASYKLTAQASSGRGVYSFCMCPGGYVVNASSVPGMLAVNGMSDYARDSGRANSAIVMTVDAADFGGTDVLDGLLFQEKLEERAYALAEGRVPCERFEDFLRDMEQGQGEETEVSGNSAGCRGGDRKSAAGRVYRAMTEEEADALCVRGRAAEVSLAELLPAGLAEDFAEGMQSFGHTIPGYSGEDAWVIGLESRTSSPVRILRDGSGQTAVRGLFPCGEGAGYAGGIMSAAVDGIKTAEAVASAWRRPV